MTRVRILPCSEGFFAGYSGFPLSLKTSTSKFLFDLQRTDTFQRVLKNCRVLRGLTMYTITMLSATNNASYILSPTVYLIRSLPLGNSSHLGHSGNGLVAKAGLSSGLSPLSFDHPQDHNGPFCPLVEHWAQGWQLSRSASVAT